MDTEAEKTQLIGSGPSAGASRSAPAHVPRAVHCTAPAQRDAAAGPGAVFELEEDERVALVGARVPHAAAEQQVSEPAAISEATPFWVVPLLKAAVGVTSVSLTCSSSIIGTLSSSHDHAPLP